ncbi:DNA-directed RNA polymerase subunit H [Candidatus Bathyarchaeota archaeon]|nr:MAG: DNA-directed RNA polymerase subunit H [Candidatus Bathyarchaeota archaeon]
MIPSFNIFEHEMVPKHEILSDEEREELLRKYRIKPYQIPHIKRSDPAVFLIGAKPGDIIKITRKSPTAGTYVTYRYVV